MKEQIEMMKGDIERKNAAMLYCVDVLVLGDDNVFTIGKTDAGYANWAVNTEDDSSYWGHYFSTYDAAVADMLDRAGVAK